MAGDGGGSSAQPPFEPPDGQSYFGFYFDPNDRTGPLSGDTRPFATRYQDAVDVELGGKPPSVFGFSQHWQALDLSMNSFSEFELVIEQFEDLYADSTPLVTWQLRGRANSDPAAITSRSVVDGSLDAYIHQFAKDVKAHGRPLFLRPICGEVNGSWWAYCSPLANPELSKTDFIDAWRRTVDIFRQEGVSNVAFVWNVITFPGTPENAAAWGIDPDIASYYPGDAYVDWISVDHYDYGDPANPVIDPLNVSLWLDPIHDFAVERGKPLFLAEWGVRSGLLTPVQQQAWLGLMFDYFASHPRLKAINYFNLNFATYTTTAGHSFLYDGQVNYAPNVNDGDGRLLAESGANFRGTFASRIGESRYTSTLLGD